MLHIVGHRPPVLESTRHLPPLLIPLIEAGQRGSDLKPVVKEIVKALGFDSFMYGASLSPRPGHEAVCHVFTNMEDCWVRRYEQRAYIEVDPRLQHTYEKAGPWMWDQSNARGRCKASDDFLDDFLDHGVGSGVAMAVPCARGHALVAFNSSISIVSEIRALQIGNCLGLMSLFKDHFHDVFMHDVVTRGLHPTGFGEELTPRELRCLRYAAHGYTNGDMAAIFGTAERTVDLHMTKVRSRLGATNRIEAVSLALGAGLVTVGELPLRSEALRDHQGILSGGVFAADERLYREAADAGAE